MIKVKDIKRKLNYLVAPFKDKMLMQKKINTLEVKYEALEELWETDFHTIRDTLMNKNEVERLKKENKNLRKKVKILSYNIIEKDNGPRGRIYDRNYNIIVDNKSLKTIIYKKEKGISKKDMIKVAEKLVEHLELDYSKLTIRMKREYLCAKEPDYCYTLVTKKEKQKVHVVSSE